MRTMILATMVVFAAACGEELPAQDATTDVTPVPPPIATVGSRCESGTVNYLRDCGPAVDSAGLVILACSGQGGPVEGCLEATSIVPAQGYAGVRQDAHCVAACPTSTSTAP